MSISMPLQPTTILQGLEKLCFSENCDALMLQTLGPLNFNQVQIHLMAVKVIYEGIFWEGCAKEIMSLWLVLVKRSQLLLS